MTVADNAPDHVLRRTRLPFALETRALTKSFGALVANDGVDFAVESGEVHALVGENGAGKTTLMNVCFGLLRPDSGTIYVGGQDVDIRSPEDARRLGLGMVHQHFKLVPSMTVCENIFLGAEARRRGSLDRRRMSAEVEAASERFGLLVNPRAVVADLSAGMQQRVEILKALYFEAQVLILDEPTAVLTPQESEALFRVVRDLAARGRSVVVITHRLREVVDASDSYSVMRRGRLVARGETAGTTQAEIAALMVGRTVSFARPDAPRPAAAGAADALVARDISLNAEDGRPVLTGVSVTVRAGEIVGIAGVEGNGQTELAEVLAGLQAPARGTVELSGRDVTALGPAQRSRRGLAHIPEDRLATGVDPKASVADNLAARYRGSNLFQNGIYRIGLARAWADELIAHYDVRGARPATAVQQLSGGNVQKVIVAREMEMDPAVLIAAQPTRGVDIGAAGFIHGKLRELRDRGAGVLLVSADLDELFAVADRIVVMFGGQVVAEFRADPGQLDAIGLAMAGVAPEPAPAVADGPGPGDSVADGVPAGRERRPAGSAIRVQATGPARSFAAARPHVALGRALAGLAGSLSQPGIAVIVALAVGVFAVLPTGANPVSAYHYLLLGSFSNQTSISFMLAQLEPLLIVAVSVFVAFRGGVFNVGAEGQMYVGAFCGAAVAFSFTSLPGPVLILLSLVAGALAGALWAALPALLYAYWNVNLIVTTLMFSYIGQYLTAYLTAGPFYDPTAGAPETKQIASQAELPKVLGPSGADVGLIVALVITVVIALVFSRTRWGLETRFVGDSVRFSSYLGIAVRRKIITIMLVSGGIAGIAGVVESLGTQYRFNQNFSPGYGFLGLTVAMLGGLKPARILVAGLAYAVLEAGAAVMQVNVNTPLALVGLLEGIIVILMTATWSRPAWRRRRGRRRRPRPNVSGPGGVVTSRPAPGEASP